MGAGPEIELGTPDSCTAHLPLSCAAPKFTTQLRRTPHIHQKCTARDAIMEQEQIKKTTLFAFFKLAPFLILKANKKGLWQEIFTCTENNFEMHSKMGTKMYHVGVVFTLVKCGM